MMVTEWLRVLHICLKSFLPPTVLQNIQIFVYVFSFEFFIQFLNFYPKIFFIYVSVDRLFLLVWGCFWHFNCVVFCSEVNEGFSVVLVVRVWSRTYIYGLKWVGCTGRSWFIDIDIDRSIDRQPPWGWRKVFGCASYSSVITNLYLRA